MRSTILLAAPTVLYAPLYLAKYLTLSREFAHIDFEYPKPPNPNKEKDKDELVDWLFHPYKETGKNIIMAVGDPMRVSLERYESHHYKPRIIQTLINKMCYWAMAEYPESKDEILNSNYKIIVHPRGMTGHTIALFDLIKFFETIQDEEKHLISNLLFYKIKPGEERIYFKNSKIAKLNNKIGYITTDPFDILKTAEDFNKSFVEKKSFIHFEDSANKKTYCDAVMTALITNDHCLQDSFKKEILKDLVKGIKEAIAFIYAEPKIASKILLKYEDDFFNPKRMKWTESLMETLFTTILYGEKIYPEDLKIDDSEIETSKKFWEKRFEFEKNEDLKNKLNTINTYIQKDW